MQAKEDIVVHPGGTTNAFGDPVTADTDEFGDPIEPAGTAPAAGEPRTVRAIVWPRTGNNETTNDRQSTVVVGLSALLPAGDPIGPTDRVFARGAMYEVEGESADYKRRGVIVALRRVRG